MEDSLEAMQPEEQNGFRQGRRIEEHLLTANVCLQKKRWPQVHHFGSSAWIFPKHLTKLIGMRYGLR